MDSLQSFTCTACTAAAALLSDGVHRAVLTSVCVQLYACNVLNLGDSKIISVHAGTARQIVRDPNFHGDVQIVDYSSITSMYGAVHCSSQVCPMLCTTLL